MKRVAQHHGRFTRDSSTLLVQHLIRYKDTGTHAPYSYPTVTLVQKQKGCQECLTQPAKQFKVQAGSAGPSSAKLPCAAYVSHWSFE